MPLTLAGTITGAIGLIGLVAVVLSERVLPDLVSADGRVHLRVGGDRRHRSQRRS